MLVGVIFFTYATASIAALVSDVDRADRVYQDRVDAFSTFCKRLKVSKKTATYISKQMVGVWKHPLANLDWRSVMNTLPLKYRLQIIVELFPDIIDHSPILERFSMFPAFLRKMIASFEPIQV